MSTPSQAANRVSPGRLWFGFAAGAAAWAIHGVGSVYIASVACRQGNPGAARLLVAILTVLALGVAVAAAVVSLRNWRRVANGGRVTDSEGKGTEEFLALAGILIGTVFTLGILWAGFPLFMGSICEAFR